MSPIEYQPTADRPRRGRSAAGWTGSSASDLGLAPQAISLHRVAVQSTTSPPSNLPHNDTKRRRGFTLVEMLVAMAITLLLMAALARAFGFVGTRIRESRADTTLASSLRDMTTRLSDELAQCTVNLQPNTSGQEDQLGYFVYYEGPMTNATSSLFRAALDVDGNLVLNDSKYGDFDDYLAFTAVAKGNNWFTGKVPRYILDQKTAQLNGVPYTLPVPAAPAFEPVVIRSKYAEIIYFASPEYPDYTGVSPLPAAPDYVDVDGDTDLNGDGDAGENGLPDRLRIHRRVLLIRPDLNLAAGNLPIQSLTVGSDTVNFMQADAWPTANNTTVTSAAVTGLGWLYGMAGIHQQCDLSVRRILNASGQPTINVAANSLADLSKPHNRFAHVRVPDGVMGGAGNDPTSMPLLALGPPATILSALTTNAPVRIAPPATPNNGPVVTPSALSGFIRPEFVLGNDFTHHDAAGDLWGRERIGEDLLTNNVLGFDIQIYDPNVSIFTTTTNGVVVGPSDAGYREALVQAVAAVGAAPPPPIDSLIVREQGGFVDLAYPVLAGGPLRGWPARRLDRRSAADSPTVGNAGGFLVTPFSGVRSYPANSQNAYQEWLFKSGKLVTVANSIRVFQPTFDTFTSFYERDGFLQGPSAGNSGTRWSTITASTTNPNVDLGSDGLDNDQTYGADDLGERETSPPFITRPESIRVTIRLENPATRQLRQSSVVHRDQL